ncbi:AAA family ATPase [Sulfitobacter pontiacus]|uniref:AAA family ATPase n=1 Tax=Sulfitobacter pontiacus TaxID=60137 RepID=UPI001046FD6E|nr:AAA family ATPase [Sulfitobacter pontiacus]
MKIRRVEVTGLLGRNQTLSVDLHDDLNIITGRNGAGKTTFLKLCWYLVSGSINQALSEIDFERLRIVTDRYAVVINKINDSTCTGEIINEVYGKRFFQDEFIDDEGLMISDARDLLSEALTSEGSSMFFPTFRRIEGGYTMRGSKTRSQHSSTRQSRELEDAMGSLADRLSSPGHSFISSISTIDIEALLLKTYADLSEQYNTLQREVSKDIIEEIRGFQEEDIGRVYNTGAKSMQNARGVINNVRNRIEVMEDQHISIMAPMTAVQSTVSKLFRHAGIKFGARLSFGEAASAVLSESLSAGEKQMLSFICYNAFTRDSVTFIDEPELSLHVDWQRSLFPTLMSQNSSNQFIIATHSPFIYSKYPDREVCIDEEYNRGDAEGASIW